MVLTKGVLPIILSLMLLLSGLGGGFNPPYNGMHVEATSTVEVNGEGISGTGSRTQDGLKLALGELGGEEVLALGLDYDTGITLTINGETQSYTFDQLAELIKDKLLGKGMDALGITQAQLEYVFGGGLTMDMAAVAPMMEDFVKPLPDLTQEGDWKTITFSGDALPRKLATAIVQLVSNDGKLDKLAALKAWGAFVPEIAPENRKAVIKQSLSAIGQKLMGAKWPFTFAISVNEKAESVKIGLDCTVNGGLLHAALDVANDEDDVKLNARAEFTPAGAQQPRAVAEYVALVDDDEESVRQSLLVTCDGMEMIHNEFSATQDGDVANLQFSTDTRDLRTGTPRLSLLGNLAINDADNTVSGMMWYKTGAYDAATGSFATQGEVELVSGRDLLFRVTENGRTALLLSGVQGDDDSLTFTYIKGDVESTWTMKSDTDENGVIEGSITRAGVETLHTLGIIARSMDDSQADYCTQQTTITVDATGTDAGAQPLHAVAKAVYSTDYTQADRRAKTMTITLDVTGGDLGEEPFSAKLEMNSSLIVDALSEPTPEPVAVPEATSAAPSLGQLLTGATLQPTPAPQAGLKPGEYTATADGFLSPITATVTVDESGKVSAVSFIADGESADYGAKLPDDATFARQFIGLTGPVDVQSVDTISGATWTSRGAAEAFNAAIMQAE